jgi:hypothetical protein
MADFTDIRYNTKMQTKTKFIVFIVILIVIVGGLGLYAGFSPQKAGKFDQFAQTLKEKGVVFYGAFWCTHCQAQKEKFGTSKKYLPYVECSTPDSKQKQICTDKKVESYPTWEFRDGIKLISNGEPIICPISTEGVVSEGLCKNSDSKYSRVWIFPEYQFTIKSPTDPIKNNNVWEFAGGVQTIGELPLTFLAEQIQFVLPQ